MIIITYILEFKSLNINNGANFCQVRSKNRILQDIFFVILGNQKCIGAPPIFNTKAKIINKDILLFVNIEYHVRFI